MHDSAAQCRYGARDTQSIAHVCRLVGLMQSCAENYQSGIRLPN
jgi:hypothetical protein